ncbi:MAG: hypothetical protein QGG17_06660 [Rhodospirillales bacterium]|jgi:hypothetical protein|nr:hypothetical protein [Rhodospirillales bacterium]MDP6803850.1 hypothetical protein [Rhodospirillales bacterium]
MITLNEATTALYGAYRLARYDPSGVNYFDTTIAGFWRSFYGAVFVAPLFLLRISIRFQNGAWDAPAVHVVAIESLAYVIGWVAFPLAMVWVARLLERESAFIRYIVAYNWALVLQSAVFIPVEALSLTRMIPIAAGNMMLLVLVMAIAGYTWFVARTALNLAPVTAAGIVALDFVLAIVIDAIAESRL